MLRKLFHIISYYIVWFTCVLSAAHHYYWIGIIISITITSIQYYWQKSIQQASHLLLLIVIITTAGFCVDSLLVTLNLISFKANPFCIYLSPPWMIGLWINFSIILYVFLKRYFLHYGLLSLFSLFGFPFAYAAGIYLGAASLPKGDIALLLIGVIWATLLPTLLYTYKKLFWS